MIGNIVPIKSEEVNEDFIAVSDYTALTPYSNRCTVKYGGFKQIGKKVKIYCVSQINSAISFNTSYYSMFAGDYAVSSSPLLLPLPKAVDNSASRKPIVIPVSAIMWSNASDNFSATVFNTSARLKIFKPSTEERWYLEVYFNTSEFTITSDTYFLIYAEYFTE